jgi:predicted dehydrogenase
MTDRICRWGILGAANIARKNWKAIRLAPNARLTAIACRDQQRGREFIAQCQMEAPFDPPPRLFGSYEELLAWDQVDAVYVPLPTGVRAQWMVRAAESGKHVLGEKPAATDADQLRHVLEACRRHGVQYMDGVMFMHSRRLERMRAILDDPSQVGEIRRVSSQFSFYGADAFRQENIRVHSQLEPMGCLGDLGWYNVRFTLWALGWQLPQQVRGWILSAASRGDSPDPVPTEFSGELLYAGGVSASFYCAFVAEHQQWGVISGTRGALHVDDFVLPFFGSDCTFQVFQSVYRTVGCDFNMEEHRQRFAVAEYSNSAVDAQETRMIERFSELAVAGTPDPFWGQVALKTQQVLDGCLRSARQEGAWVAL